MDIRTEYWGTAFVCRHGINIVEAALALHDPLLVTLDEGKDKELCARIGLSTSGRLLAVRAQIEGDSIRIVSAWCASAAEEALYGR